MKKTNSIKDIIKGLTYNASPQLKEKVFTNVLPRLEKIQQKNSNKQNVGRIILKGRITKFATAALIIVAVFVGMKIIISSTEAPPTVTEKHRIIEKLHTELREVRQMAIIGDVKGLAKILSAGQFESKLVAANFLAKMGEILFLDQLPMHASGDLIIDVKSGNIRLRSTNNPEWLEMTEDTLRVYTDQSVNEAEEVRLTYDFGDAEEWDRLQKESAYARQEKADLERKLAELSKSPPKDIEQLRKRLVMYNRMLDHMDGAIYVSIENGRLKLHDPSYQSTAFAELHDGIVRVERHGNVVEANSITLLHKLAPVRTDGPPEPISGWRTRFDHVYSLDDGEILRWVRSPFIPERQIYATQELKYYQSTSNPPPPGYLFFRWNGNLYNWTLAMDECNLAMVLHSMGLNRYQYDGGPEKLGLLKLGGDWIERNNVPIEDKLIALEQILEKELDSTIIFEKGKVNRDVIIVHGQYEQVPLEGVEHPKNIYIYPDSWGKFSGPEPSSGGGTRSLVKLIEMVGSNFNRPIVFEAENLSDINVSYFTSLSYSFAIANAKTEEDKQEILDSVLQNLSKQTSLQFEYGQDEHDIWFISERNKTE